MATTPQTMTMPVSGKIGLGIALIMAIIITGFSFFSLLIDVILKFNLYGILIDLIFLGIGIFLGYFSLRMYKNSVYYESLVNSAFDEGVYTRLEPVLRKIAETSVEMEDLEGRLNRIDRKVQTVIDEQVKTEKSPYSEVEKMIVPGTSMSFVVKAIFLAIITMSGFLFMIFNRPRPLLVAYCAILMFYILWWALISSEFKLFDNSAAWGIAFVPILLVPLSFMILDALLQPNTLVALFYALLVLYVFLYFSWAVYETKGTLPFNLDLSKYIKIKHR
jgi:hypothetical protein